MEVEAQEGRVRFVLGGMKKKIEDVFGGETFRIALGVGEERRGVLGHIVSFTEENLAILGVENVSIQIEPDYAYILAPDEKILDRWVKAWKKFLLVS